jgi:quercetin dioxygenase-like cupin family protein
MADTPIDLASIPVHLGLGATISVQEAFTGEMSWYQRYGERVAVDGVEGRLVTIHSFDEPWDSWEVHPEGHELVLCLEGRITLHQERDGQVTQVTLEPYQAAINEPGVWHTADVEGRATALFITAGMGTSHRPR